MRPGESASAREAAAAGGEAYCRPIDCGEQMKIVHKLALGSVLFALLIWCVGDLAARISRKALQKTIEDTSTSFAKHVLYTIDKYILDRMEGIEEYATDLALQEALAQSNDKFERMDDAAAYIQQKDREWISAAPESATPFMNEIMDNMLSRELKEKVEFHRSRHDHPVFAEIFATNRFGAVVGTSNRTSDYRQDDEQWWQSAKTNGLSVTDVGLDESSGVYGIDIAVRINDDGGRFMGVILAVLSIEELTGVVARLRPTTHGRTLKSSRYWLLTKAGKVIYSTERHKLLEAAPDHLSEHFHRGEDDASHPAHRNTHADMHGDAFVVFAYSTGFENFKGLGWGLQIEHDPKEIFASAEVLRKNIRIVTLAVAILALLGGWWVSRSISGRIKRLSSATIEIGEGNLGARVDDSGNDELSELAGGFNRMSEKLEQADQYLREYTAEVERFNRMAVGREERMIELKREVNEMAREAGVGPPYDLSFVRTTGADDTPEPISPGVNS